MSGTDQGATENKRAKAKNRVHISVLLSALTRVFAFPVGAFKRALSKYDFLGHSSQPFIVRGLPNEHSESEAS